MGDGEAACINVGEQRLHARRRTEPQRQFRSHRMGLEEFE